MTPSQSIALPQTQTMYTNLVIRAQKESDENRRRLLMQLVRPIFLINSNVMTNLKHSTKLFNIEEMFPSDRKSQNIFSSHWS